MRVGVIGIGGRIGRVLAAMVPERGHELSGGIGRTDAADALAALAAVSDAVIDFSHASVVGKTARVLATASAAWVLGTTGLDDQAQAAVATCARHVPVVQAANFSAGVALVVALAARLGALLPEDTYDAELLEMHHRHKRDAPSGTAKRIGEAVAAGRARRLADVGVYARGGETGARPAGAIGFATLRGGAIVGEHALSFTSEGERLTLRHEVFDRRVFADGALRAAAWSSGRSPGLYGMDEVLGLAES